MRPLVGKAADLGQYIPTKMPPLTLRDLGETKDAGVDVLKRYRKNLPYFLSSPASMEDMFGALQRKPSGSRLRDLYEVHPDGGGQVAQIIKYIAGEAPKESPPNPLENVPLGMYGKDQVDDIVKSVHEASEKQLK